MRATESTSGRAFVGRGIICRDNKGDGLHVEGTGKATVIDPNFVSIPGALMEQAKRVIIHPSYMPIDEEASPSSTRHILQPIRWNRIIGSDPEQLRTTIRAYCCHRPDI